MNKSSSKKSYGPYIKATAREESSFSDLGEISPLNP